MQTRMGKRRFAAVATSLVVMVCLATPAVADDVAQVYAKQCASCHGATGKGDGSAAKILNPKPADLSDPAWAQAAKDEEITKIIKGGGVAVGKARTMPAFPKLSDQDVAGLVKLLRGFSAGQ